MNVDLKSQREQTMMKMTTENSCHVLNVRKINWCVVVTHKTFTQSLGQWIFRERVETLEELTKKANVSAMVELWRSAGWNVQVVTVGLHMKNLDQLLLVKVFLIEIHSTTVRYIWNMRAAVSRFTTSKIYIFNSIPPLLPKLKCFLLTLIFYIILPFKYLSICHKNSV